MIFMQTFCFVFFSSFFKKSVPHHSGCPLAFLKSDVDYYHYYIIIIVMTVNPDLMHISFFSKCLSLIYLL